MGKKRRSEDSAEPHAPLKKDTFLEFNGTVFKSMLKEPAQAMKGLEKFISTAKKLPSPDLYDVVEGYIKISMECVEIFKLLEGEKQVESELMLIFESLEMILLRTASDLTHFNTVGNAIVKKTVSSHMKSLLASLHSNNHRFVRQCLSFLSALVAQGPEAAREVLSNIHAYRPLSGLAKRKDKQGKPDVRMAFIQFVLSFLVSGDNATIGQILEIKEFLPEILNTGLKEDRLSIVNLILSTLRSRVVLNKAISKTQKVRFFTPAVLASLASLYKWNGIVDAATEEESMEDSQQNGILVVRELVHSFLLDLCSSRKHGISFHDANFGTVGRAGNIVLLQFLVGLKQATEDELVAELVVNVLKASPDILSRYFKETQYSYTPRVKSAWQDNVKFLKKIYEAQPEISTVFQTQEVIPPSRLLNMINVLSLPPVCNKAFFTQGLCLANTAVQLTTFSIMNFILKRANKNIEYLLDRAESNGPDVFTADMMADLVQQYRETLSKILPDMTSIIGKWQSLSKKEKTEGDATKAQNKESVEEADVKETQAPETAEVIFLKALILQVICLYQKVVPHLVGQCKFDFSKLLKGIMSEKGINEEVPPVLQYHILQLALELPSSKFSWFRLQDAADIESSSAEKSVLFQILKMFVSSSTSHLKTSTRMLVLKVLRDSGVFEYTWTELDLWLDQLTILEPSQQETVIHFLEKVLAKLVSSSHVYTDKVASLVQEAAFLQANLSGQEGDATSIPVSHIDDVLDMLDVIMESNDGEMEEFGPPLSEDLIIQTFPFSALVPAVLEARNKLPAGKNVVYEYVNEVLSRVLHCQRDPLPLCLALLQYDKELVLSETSAPPHPSVVHLHRYYSKWLPPQSAADLFKSEVLDLNQLQSAVSFTSLMKVTYIQGPTALLKENLMESLENALVSMSQVEFPVAMKQILLYTKTTVEDFGTFSKDTGTAVLKTLMRILHDLVTKLQNFKEVTPLEPTEENSRDGSDLFLETNQLTEVQSNKEQVLLSGLGSILKHSCLQQWFLALELAVFPPHSLKPVRLKQLCAQMTKDILALLKIIAPSLQNLSSLDLLGSYTDAIVKAVLKELTDTNIQAVKTQSRPMEALLSLHSYMDFSDVKEVVSKLLLLPKERLFFKEGTELSSYGQAALQILTQSTSSESMFLSQAHLHGLGTLLLSCSSPALEAFLLQTLSSEPGSAKLIHTEVLLHCLHQPRADCQAIASLLLHNCSTHRLCFEVWCSEPENMGKLVMETETFLPLIKTYLQLVTRDDPARPKDVQDQVLKMLKGTLLPKLSKCVLENLPENSGALFVETLTSLIRLSTDPEDIEDLINSLPSALQKTDTLERWQLVDVITEKLADCPEELEKWRKAIMAAALMCLKASYGQAKDPSASLSEQEQSVLETLQKLLTRAEDISASEWNSFIKTGLKYRYKHSFFLTSLTSLIEVMYSATEAPKDLLPLATLHMMTSSHSMFLSSMLDSTEEQTGIQAKAALVSLLLCLVKKCPAVCNVSHFVVLLGAYGASLSTLDQKLLLLLEEYERNGVSLLKFQSFLWGPAAVEHHKAKKSLGTSLWKQTSTDELLALLKTDRMLQTITQFPQQRRLIPQDDKEPLFLSNEEKDLGNLYDPRFLLPLFSAILRPESVVDCLKFVSCHALGVTVMALSSYDPKLRAAAYHVLTCFYQHLEGARLKEKNQLLYLMDIVKNGIRQRNQRLPFILTTYISKVAQQMLKPEDHMYIVLNRFLLSHQSLDFRRVPEFFKLFYGFDLEHKLEREWILSVLEEGISDRYCYELCEQQRIFQSLLGFGSSPLCDDHAQAQIIRVLCHAAKVTQAAYNLTKNCGLLNWIIQMVEKRKLHQQLLCAIMELLHVLWFTNLGQKEKQLDELESSSSTEVKTVKCLPLPLICEFIFVASTISRHLRLGVKATHFTMFLQTYCSALKHYVRVLDIDKQANRFTVPPEPLSCAEALSLLHCWASLFRNTALLSQIQSLSETHKLKELLGMGKDRARAKSSRSQAHGKKENLSEESVTEKEGLLHRESQLYLCAIFSYWKPVFSVTEAQPSQLSDNSEPSQLAKDTAQLLIAWSLRCLLENSCAENGTKDFLRWVENAVIEHKQIVEALLLDPALKADLLRLYHQAFQSQCNSTIPQRMGTLKLFTKIMMRLLETQGHLPEMYQAVVSSCLLGDTSNDSKHVAGVFLSSLYIHELWSGVLSAELFLSHVKMVTKHETKKQRGSKWTLSDSNVRSICNDIVRKSDN